MRPALFDYIHAYSVEAAEDVLQDAPSAASWALPADRIWGFLGIRRKLHMRIVYIYMRVCVGRVLGLASFSCVGSARLAHVPSKGRGHLRTVRGEMPATRYG